MSLKVTMARALLGLAAVVTSMQAHAADPDGRAWKSVFRLDCPSVSGGCTSTQDMLAPQVAVNTRGDSAVVWQVVDGQGVAHIFASLHDSSTHNWSEPVQVDGPAGGSSDPQVAIDAAGNAMTVWTQTGEVQARLLRNDGTQGAITPLQSLRGRGSSPRVAMASNGVAIVVWDQSDGSSHQRVWARRYTANELEQWEENPAILDANVGEARAAQIAIGADGDGLAAWEQNGTRVSTSRYVASEQRWAGAVDVPSASTRASSVQVALGSNGIARTVWIGFDAAANRNRVWSSRFFFRWEQAIAIDSNVGNASQAQLAMDRNNNTLVVWSQSDETRTNVWSNRTFANSSAWDTAVLVENLDADANLPSLAMDATGNAQAMWHQKQPGARFLSIYAARYTPAFTLRDSWQTPVIVENDERGDAFLPRLAFDGNGTARAAWYQFDGQHFGINSTHYGPRQWTTAVKVGLGVKFDARAGQGISDPHTAMGANGNVVAAWAQRSAGEVWTIFANRYAAGRWSKPEPIQNVSTGDGANVRVAVDPAGNVVALWDQIENQGTTGERSRIWWNFYSVATDRWVGAQPLRPETTGRFGLPDIVYDAHSNAFVAVWNAISDRIFRLFSSRFVAGAWTAPVIIDGALGVGSMRKLAVGDGGHVVAMWSSFSAIMTNRATPNGLWGTATSLRTSTTANLVNMTLAVDKGGNTLALWNEVPRVQGDNTFAHTDVVWNRFSVAANGTGGSWAGVQTLITDVPLTLGIPIVFTPDGNAFLLCNQAVAPGNDYRVRLNHYTASTNSWDGFTPIGVEDPIDPQVTVHSDFLDLAVDASGNLLAGWMETLSDDDGQTASGPWYNNLAPGTPPSMQSKLDSGSERALWWQQGMLEANGNGAIVWAQFARDNTVNVWARKFE